MAGGLYRLECEYTRSDSGIWHEVEVADPGSVRDVGQAERLDADRPLAARWRPLPVVVERYRRGGDFFQLEDRHWSATPAAVKALRPLLRDRVEILPLNIVADYEQDEDYDFDELPARPKLRERYPRLFVLHPLDRVKLSPSAEVEYFLDDADEGVITDVDRYAFRPADIEGRHYFRIKGDDEHCLVSEEFRQAAQRLRGLLFRPIKYVVDDGAPEAARGGRPRAARTSAGRGARRRS